MFKMGSIDNSKNVQNWACFSVCVGGAFACLSNISLIQNSVAQKFTNENIENMEITPMPTYHVYANDHLLLQACLMRNA